MNVCIGFPIFTASRKHFTLFSFLLFTKYLNSSKNFRVTTHILPRTSFLMHAIYLRALRFPSRHYGLTVVFKNNKSCISPCTSDYKQYLTISEVAATKGVSKLVVLKHIPFEDFSTVDEKWTSCFPNTNQSLHCHYREKAGLVTNIILTDILMVTKCYCNYCILIRLLYVMNGMIS